MMPLITTGEVVQQFPDTGQLQVILRTTGASPTVPVMVGYHGFADALRINQKPLPGRGTWGVIAFPNGDDRNGIWLMSYYPNRADAITASAAGDQMVPSDAFLDYESHWSGLVTLLDAIGQQATQFPDGSYVSFGQSSGMPAVYRHTVDNSGARTRVESTLADRVSGTVAPFGVYLSMNSGAQAMVDTSGAVVITAASGASLTIQVSGFGALVIDHAGNINASLAGGVFNINQGSGMATDTLALVSKLTNQLTSLQNDYNGHHHLVTGFQSGGGSNNSGGPSSTWTLGDISAVDIKIDK